MNAFLQRHLVGHAFLAAGLAFVATSWPGNNQYMLSVSLAAVVVIGSLWIVAVVRHVRESAKAGRKLIGVPLIGAIAIAASLFNVSLRLRFALVEDSFQAEVTNIKLRPETTDVKLFEVGDRIGGYSIRSAHQSGSAVFFRITDEWRGPGPDGFAYIPNGLDSNYNPQTWWPADFTKISDDWYAYNTTPSGFDAPVGVPIEE